MNYVNNRTSSQNISYRLSYTSDILSILNCQQQVAKFHILRQSTGWFIKSEHKCLMHFGIKINHILVCSSQWQWRNTNVNKIIILAFRHIYILISVLYGFEAAPDNRLCAKGGNLFSKLIKEQGCETRNVNEMHLPNSVKHPWLQHCRYSRACAYILFNHK